MFLPFPIISLNSFSTISNVHTNSAKAIDGTQRNNDFFLFNLDLLEKYQNLYVLCSCTMVDPIHRAGEFEYNLYRFREQYFSMQQLGITLAISYYTPYFSLQFKFSRIFEKIEFGKLCIASKSK